PAGKNQRLNAASHTNPFFFNGTIIEVTIAGFWVQGWALASRLARAPVPTCPVLIHVECYHSYPSPHAPPATVPNSARFAHFPGCGRGGGGTAQACASRARPPSSRRRRLHLREFKLDASLGYRQASAARSTRL